MINRVGNSDDELRFSSAGFDTDMMLNQEPSYSNIVGFCQLRVFWECQEH